MKIVFLKTIAIIIVVIIAVALLITTDPIKLLGWDSTITIKGLLISTVAIVLLSKVLNITGKID